MTPAGTSVRPLAEARIPDLAEAFARAFHDDSLAVHMLPDDADRRRFLPMHFSVPLRLGYLFGEVPSVETDAAAIWFGPEDWEPTEEQLRQAGAFEVLARLPDGAADRFAAAMEFGDEIHRRWISGPHFHLALIGVDPRAQGRGLGRRLITPHLAEADRLSMPCWLETAARDNVAYYEALGFEVATNATVPGTALELWSMMRPPT